MVLDVAFKEESINGSWLGRRILVRLSLQSCLKVIELEPHVAIECFLFLSWMTEDDRLFLTGAEFVAAHRVSVVISPWGQKDHILQHTLGTL